MRFIDAFVPGSVASEDADVRRSARVLAAGCLATMGAAGSVTIAALCLDFHEGVAPPVAGFAVCGAALLALKRGAPAAALTAVLGVAIFGIATQAAVVFGGIGAPPLSWYGLLPMFVLLVGGRRLGVAFAALAALGHVAFFSSGRVAVVPREAWLFDGLAGTAFVLAVSLAYDTFKRRAMEEMRAAHACAEMLRLELIADREELREKSFALESHIERLRATQEQLIESGKLAAIGQLAAGVAHELNNPLGVIMGFAQGLERRVAPADPFSKPVASIVREANRCKHLIEELLTFSRVTRVAREPTDLRSVVSAAAELLRTRCAAEQISLDEEVMELPVIAANPRQLQQVLLNLGINGLDAMTPGGVLTLRATCLDEALCIEVQDTGTGISDEVKRRMFEPFFTTKEVGRGTGLGLSIAHEIVQQHGGSIEVITRLGAGTTMRVTLPKPAGRAPAPAEDAASAGRQC